MKELQKYSLSNKFLFKVKDNLSLVCNAPSGKFAGLYLVYSINGNNRELIYIGISGRIEAKSGKLKARKDGIKGRIVRGKRDGEPRKKYWIREMIKENFDALEIIWYVTHDADKFKDCPKIIEKELIKKYKPRWNRTYSI